MAATGAIGLEPALWDEQVVGVLTAVPGSGRGCPGEILDRPTG